MKIRKEFVSNSSSQSFIVAVNDAKEKHVIKTVATSDLHKHVTKEITTIEQLIDHFQAEHLYATTEELLEIEEYRNAKQALTSGKTILIGRFCSEGDYIETAFCELGLDQKMNPDIIVIKGEGGY